MSSDTGEIGGQTIGHSMTHYVIPDGKFDTLTKELLKKKIIRWESGKKTNQPGSEYNKNKVKYTCPDCKINVWGKPGLNVACVDCSIQLKAID